MGGSKAVPGHRILTDEWAMLWHLDLQSFKEVLHVYAAVT